MLYRYQNKETLFLHTTLTEWCLQHSVYCAVQTKASNTVQLKVVLKMLWRIRGMIFMLLICIYMLLLPEGQMIEAWEPSKKQFLLGKKLNNQIDSVASFSNTS